MRAAVLEQFGHALAVADIPPPQPAAGEILISVEACGMCRMDRHIAHGRWRPLPKLPLVLGHEVVGKVSRLGEGVTHLHIGQRVAVGWLGGACGHCEACWAGQGWRCSQVVHTGLDRDGGFAEQVTARADYAVPVPPRVDPLDAACLTCAGAAALRAVRSVGAALGSRLAVVGVGGVGHLAVQYARLAGADVVAVDVNHRRLALARELGAAHTLGTGTTDHGLAVDAAVLTTDAPGAADTARSLLRTGGRLLVVATALEGTSLVPGPDLLDRMLTVAAAPGATRRDIARVFELHRAGHTRVAHQARFLERVDAALEELGADDAPAQLVLEMR